MYGPTNASPIIANVAKLARQVIIATNIWLQWFSRHFIWVIYVNISQALQEERAGNYFVLLMITDGILTDMEQTIHTIIEASELPMSIIIVGVGEADFSDMERLDADDKLWVTYYRFYFMWYYT